MSFDAMGQFFTGDVTGVDGDDRIIDHFMGYQTEEMRTRYRHLLPEEKRKEFCRLKY